MKYLMILLLVITLGACSPGVQVANDENKVNDQKSEERVVVEDYPFTHSDEVSETNNSNSGEEEEEEEEEESDDTSSDDSENDASEEDSNDSTSQEESEEELVELCGVIYRSKDESIKFIESNKEEILNLSSSSSSAESIMEDIKFPNDARSACIWGDYKNVNLNNKVVFNGALYISTMNVTYQTKSDEDFEASNIQIDIYESTDHPERIDLQDQYPYYKCGEIFTNVDYVHQEDNLSTVQLKDEERTFYIVSDDLDDSIRSEIENSSSGTINGCVYGSSDDYLDASISSKRFFEYEEMDVGWY